MSRGILVVAVIALLAGGVAFAQVGAQAGHARPKLRLVALAPVAVRGSGFGVRERIRVRLRSLSGRTAVRRVRASRAGSFKAAFPAVMVDRCSGLTVTAAGTSGRRAMVRWRTAPKCPPA